MMKDLRPFWSRRIFFERISLSGNFSFGAYIFLKFTTEVRSVSRDLLGMGLVWSPRRGLGLKAFRLRVFLSFRGLVLDLRAPDRLRRTGSIFDKGWSAVVAVEFGFEENWAFSG